MDECATQMRDAFSIRDEFYPIEVPSSFTL
jgi:hypothetical protein